MKKQEMVEKDLKSQNKIDNYNPMNIPENVPSTQEYHHARHALYFLYFGTYSVINNKTAWCTQDKMERVRVHLNCLREFIAEDTVLEHAVNVLLQQLNRVKPRDHREWSHFLFYYWKWIHQIAVHYGEAKKCFPDSYFHALEKIVKSDD